MLVVTKGRKIFNTLAALVVVAGAVLGAGAGRAAPRDEGPARQTVSREPVPTLETPEAVWSIFASAKKESQQFRTRTTAA